MKKVILCATVCAMTFSGVSAAAEEISEVKEACSQFNSVYGGLGFGGSFLKGLGKKFNRFMGTAVIGAGKAFKGKYYAGGEFLLDFMKAKEKEANVRIDEDNVDLYVKSNGVRPQLALKAGYVFKGNTLAYGKVGAVWSRVKAREKATNKEETKSKWGTTLALGVERVCKKFSVAFEPEYSFGFKHRGKRVNDGWNVRALLKYNINI